MAALAFDTLQYARRLLAAGVPEGQANVQAEAMAEAFGFYVGNLVTRDYLDARLDQRFTESERWIDRRFFESEEKFESRFAEQDKKFFGQLVEQEQKFDRRFTALEQKFDGRFAAVDGRFAAVEARLGRLESSVRLHTWMLGLILLVLVVPELERLLA